jgi:hypothetical protein
MRSKKEQIIDGFVTQAGAQFCNKQAKRTKGSYTESTQICLFFELLLSNKPFFSCEAWT